MNCNTIVLFTCDQSQKCMWSLLKATQKSACGPCGQLIGFGTNFGFMHHLLLVCTNFVQCNSRDKKPPTKTENHMYDLDLFQFLQKICFKKSACGPCCKYLGFSVTTCTTSKRKKLYATPTFHYELLSIYS